jgi:alpha-galactosidase
MYKALLGPRAAVYGDHVELTRITGADTSREEDLGDDFASTLGTGGVLGTKFTWPDYGKNFANVYLSEKNTRIGKKWISVYNEKMLRGLSDRTYRVTDYVHDKDFGVVKGPTAKLSTEIRGSLLLEVR